MFIQHNDLIDENKLPPTAFYLEPRDLEKIPVIKGDTLQKLISRVEISREKKGYLKLNPAEIRLLVVAALEHSTAQADIPKYFERHGTLPQFAQMAQVAQTIMAQIGAKSVGLDQRQERAAKCLGCAIHRSHNRIANVPAQMIDTLISGTPTHESLLDMQVSTEETQLGTCGMCGCGLASKIKIKSLAAVASIRPDQLDILLKIYGSDAFESCWILNEGINDAHLRPILDAKLKATRSQGSELFKAYLEKKRLEAMPTTPPEPEKK